MTEEDIKQFIRLHNLDHEHNWIVGLLLEECQELDPWLPIDENTPKDRPIKIYDRGYGQVVIDWNEFGGCFTSAYGSKYLTRHTTKNYLKTQRSKIWLTLQCLTPYPPC